MSKKTLDKTKLIAIIAKSTALTKVNVANVLDELIYQIKEEALKNGNIVTLKGFGRFEKKTRSGKIMSTKSHKLIEYETSRLAFKCSNTLKD